MQAGGKGLDVTVPPLAAPVLAASSKALSNEGSLSNFLFRSGKAKRGSCSASKEQGTSAVQGRERYKDRAVSWGQTSSGMGNTMEGQGEVRTQGPVFANY